MSRTSAIIRIQNELRVGASARSDAVNIMTRLSTPKMTDESSVSER